MCVYKHTHTHIYMNHFAVHLKHVNQLYFNKIFRKKNSEPYCKIKVWMIMMCQCRFIHSNKGTTLVWNIDSEVIRVGTGGIGDSVLSSHFCCEPKTALKYKGYYFCEWIWGSCSHLTETNVINNLVKKKNSTQSKSLNILAFHML